MPGADRSITVRLKADVAGAITGIRATAAAVKDFGTQTLASADKNARSWDRVGKTMLISGVAIAAAIGLSVHAAAEFDKAMSSVAANVDDKSIPSLERLRQAALDAGTSTAFSARDAADAENELAKAGVSAADIVGGALTASLTLASAGQLDLESAAAITSATMVQFGLHAEDAAHIADDLSAGADKSLGSVQDLGEAMKYSGVFAAQLGISLDTTVGTLAQFASYGIIGSQAGTGLRQVIVSLTAPTDEAKAALDKYGISVYDSQGKFVGLDKVAGQLHDRLGGLTDSQKQAALSTIFTSRSIAEATILMKDGAEGTRKWTAAVNDQGFAAQQARTKLDNLSGDLTKLKNTFNVALIDTGEEATGALRGMTQEVTHLIAAFDDLSPSSKGVIVTTAAVLAGVLLLGGGLLVTVPKVLAFRTALLALTGAETVGAALKGIGTFLIGPWGIALAAGTLALGLFAKAHIDSAGRVHDLTTALEQDNYMLGENTRLTIANNLEKSGLIDQAKKFGVSLDDLAGAAEGNADSTARVNAELDQYVDHLGESAKNGTAAAAGAARQSLAVDQFRGALLGANGELDKAKVKAADHAEILGKDAQAAQDAATASHTFSTSIVDVSGDLRDAKFDVTEFDNALTNLGHAFDVKDKTDELTKGFRDLAKQAKGSSTAVRGNSNAAIANRQSLHQLYGVALSIVQAYADQKDAAGNLIHTSDEVKAKAKQVADSFQNQAGKAGFNAGKVKDLTDNLNDVPAEVASNVTIGIDVVGVSTAARQLGYLQGLANKLAARDYGPNEPPHALGSRSTGGGLGWVGEKGPELVRLPLGSQVYPNGTAPMDAVKFTPQYAAAYGGASGPQFTVYVTAPPNTRNPAAWGERMMRGASRVLIAQGLGG